MNENKILIKIENFRKSLAKFELRKQLWAGHLWNPSYFKPLCQRILNNKL